MVLKLCPLGVGKRERMGKGGEGRWEGKGRERSDRRGTQGNPRTAVETFSPLDTKATS